MPNRGHNDGEVRSCQSVAPRTLGNATNSSRQRYPQINLIPRYEDALAVVDLKDT